MYVTNPLTRKSVVCVCNGATLAAGCVEAVFTATSRRGDVR